MFQKLLTEMAINLVKDKASVIASTVAKEGISLATQIHEDGISNTVKNAYGASKQYVKSITDKNVTVEKDKVYMIKDGYQFLMVDDVNIEETTVSGYGFYTLSSEECPTLFYSLPNNLPYGYTLMEVNEEKILIIPRHLVSVNVVPFPIKKL